MFNYTVEQLSVLLFQERVQIEVLKSLKYNLTIKRVENDVWEGKHCLTVFFISICCMILWISGYCGSLDTVDLDTVDLWILWISGYCGSGYCGSLDTVDLDTVDLDTVDLWILWI